MYAVFNIGCIECGISSNIVGIFSDKVNACKIAEELDERMDWRNGGQNHYEVFELPEPEIINPEYLPE